MSEKSAPTPVKTNVSDFSASRELTLIRHALDQSAIVAITDRAGNIIHINDKFCEISKYTREELLGKNHRVINSGYHSREFFESMWKTISSGQVWEGEIRNRAKDGSFYWVNTTIVPFAEGDDLPYQYVSIRYEITQRKNAEAQLRVYAERLEQSHREVLEREAQIVRQDRLASVGLLASSLAHEIGNPLGIIRGRAEFLGLRQTDPEVKNGIAIIIAQIDRVSKLIRSLLNLARGNENHDLVEIRVENSVENVLDLLGHEFRKHEVRVENELAGGTYAIKAEVEPFQQVILNLMINALQAIEAARASGRKSDHFFRIRMNDQDTQWSLSFEDSGCGIDPANMKNLFKPFFTTKELGVGTGLGLATSYGIVRSWQGNIEVESVPGVGTRFTLLLPKSRV